MDTLLLYGFDARAPLDAPDPAWTEDRREMYLLRKDAARPVSVDRAVWPPVSPAAATDGFAPDYWADLDALRRACTTAGSTDRSSTLVALSVVEDTDVARALLVPCRPAAIPADWRPLGWDVADTGLISGLSNCGFVLDVDDVAELRGRFAPRLNRYGLFDSVSDARVFRELSNARVPEHAPFLIHRILAIPW